MSIISSFSLRQPVRLTLVTLACMLGPSSHAYQVHAQTQTQSESQSQSQRPDESVETFKVDVSVVNIFYNVKDKHGALVPGLKKEDFDLYEDGQPQKIKYYNSESNLPLTLGLLIDTSGSQERVLAMEKEVGAAFLKQVLREKDLAFLINFDVNVDLDQDYTASAREIREAMEKVRINTGGMNGGPPGLGGGPIDIPHPRGTLLYDAVYLAADEKLSHEVGRKAMIILSDGEDQGSKLRIQDAIEAAQKADTICYVLLIADRGFYGAGGMGYSGDREMRKLTEETGGRVIDVGNNPRKLQEGFDQISNELRSQYSIGYSSTNTKRDGTFRKIEIKTKAGKIQARRGYYAPTR